MNYKVTKCISKQDTEKPRTALKLCFLKEKKQNKNCHLSKKQKNKNLFYFKNGWLFFNMQESNLIPPLETLCVCVCVLMPIFTTYRQKHF